MTTFKNYLYTENKELVKTYIFCDMDGVLVNWNKGFFDKYGFHRDDVSKKEGYKLSNSLPSSWWANLEWMPDGEQLWSYLMVLRSKNIIKLHILSSPTDPPDACKRGKIQWLIDNGIVSSIGQDNCIIDSDKSKYVVSDKISILIDDTPKKIDKWTEANGVGILHTNTNNTISQLKTILDI